MLRVSTVRAPGWEAVPLVLKGIFAGIANVDFACWIPHNSISRSQKGAVQIHRHPHGSAALYQTVQLKCEKWRWNTEYFCDAEEVSAAGMNFIQRLLVADQKIGSEEIGFAFQFSLRGIYFKITHRLGTKPNLMLVDVSQLMSSNYNLIFWDQQTIYNDIFGAILYGSEAFQTVCGETIRDPELHIRDGVNEFKRVACSILTDEAFNLIMYTCVKHLVTSFL